MGAMRRELDRGLGSGLGSGLSVSQSVCLIQQLMKIPLKRIEGVKGFYFQLISLSKNC